MRFIPIGSEFAAEVEGIDLCAPFDAAAVAVIHAGMDRHAVLVFHDQPLTDEQQIAFTRSLGKIELNTANNVTRLDQRRLSIEMSDISNLDQHSNMLARDDRRRAFNLGNRLWHSDSSFKSVSAKYSLLSARIIPSAGGNTEFADMRAAYDALDPEIKAEIEDLITEHSLLFSRGQLGFTDFTEEERVKFAPVRHRLVRTNPTTGRKSLFLSSHIGGIVGWPVPEAMAFVRDLAEHATQRQFVYAHTWRQHDLVMWDNRQTMHRARRYKETSEVRDMRRTTLEGDGPTTLQMRWHRNLFGWLIADETNDQEDWASFPVASRPTYGGHGSKPVKLIASKCFPVGPRIAQYLIQGRARARNTDSKHRSV